MMYDVCTFVCVYAYVFVCMYVCVCVCFLTVLVNIITLINCVIGYSVRFLITDVANVQNLNVYKCTKPNILLIYDGI